MRNGSNGAVGRAATFEITGATALAYGVTPTVTEQSDSTEQARKYKLGIPQGKPGDPGTPGKDGHTPVRGVDYWNDADKSEMEAYIASELAKRGQLKPEFAQTIEECTDTTKLYILPDGMIYAYMLTEIESGPSYDNLLPKATNSDKTLYVGANGEKGYKRGWRVSSSGTEKEQAGFDCTGFIPATKGQTVRIKNVTQLTTSNDGSGYCSAYFYTSAYAKTTGSIALRSNAAYENGVYSFAIPDYDSIAFFRVSLIGITPETIITVDEEITDGGGTTVVTEYTWISTGLAFVPADYEDRIIEVEGTTTKHTKQIDEHASRITALEKAIESGSTDETKEAALEKIKVWTKPVYDDAPVTLLGDDRIKPGLTTGDLTIEAIYEKYRALRDDPSHPENSLYITESNLGPCTVSDIVPGFTGKDILRFDFCEPSGITEVDDPSTPKVPDPARETKPKLIFLSGIHKEWAGVYGLYYALEEIANNPEFEDIRRNAHIIVIPCANPFGLIAEWTTTTNGWAAPSDWGAPSHVNANGIAPHNNFGVGYKANQNVIGSYNHSGQEPYSELETQYIDRVMAENSDAIAFVSCHNFNNGGAGYGCTAMWASSASYYMCNLVYRLVDKLTKAWLRKYGDTLKQSIDSVKQNMSAADYRLGRATMSTSAGTEQLNATQYGIPAVNLEVSDKWVVFSNVRLSSEGNTHAAEVYANFIRTILRAYDHKDRKEYAPNLPWRG